MALMLFVFIQIANKKRFLLTIFEIKRERETWGLGFVRTLSKPSNIPTLRVKKEGIVVENLSLHLGAM